MANINIENNTSDNDHASNDIDNQINYKKNQSPIVAKNTTHSAVNSISSDMSNSLQAEPLIRLQNVGFTIDQESLVTSINLQVVPNDMISIIGPNGAGKSTLMKLILGLIKPTTGTIEKSNSLILGYVPQKFNVPKILPLRVLDLFKQARKGRVSVSQREELYNALNLKPLMNRQLINLSGGETQRVLMARALLDKPNLLILDEPMQGLDPDSERMLYQFIDDLPDFLRCAMLVVSHDLHWVMKGSRHVICLNKHICCEGQPADIRELSEFKRLFAYDFTIHKYEQPYIHQHDKCNHL